MRNVLLKMAIGYAGLGAAIGLGALLKRCELRDYALWAALILFLCGFAYVIGDSVCIRREDMRTMGHNPKPPNVQRPDVLPGRPPGQGGRSG